MISVKEARKQIRDHVKVLEGITCTIGDALGAVLTEDVIAPTDMPPFNQAAMDGYAVRTRDLQSCRQLPVAGEAAAGRPFKGAMLPGTAVRIFTGAPVPDGADRVIAQEDVQAENGCLQAGRQLSRGKSNIRKTGHLIGKGKPVLKKGQVLTPAGIAFLAAAGIARVKVIRRPRIAVFVTGDELKAPGLRLGEGQVYECNSFALAAAVRSLDLKLVEAVHLPDDLRVMAGALRKSMEGSDMVLICGGISVGKYDHTKEVLGKLGVEAIFYKVKQKPGKPLFFGRRGNTFLFGLPGNPAAVLTCFYEYVYPAIVAMAGRKRVVIRKKKMTLSASCHKKRGLTLFLRGKTKGKFVMPLRGQESFMLRSFAMADCLIHLPENEGDVRAGVMVEVHLLPGVSC